MPRRPLELASCRGVSFVRLGARRRANHGLPDASGRPAGYCVDAINRSSGVASAYIIAVSAGLPVGIFDLYAWYRLHLPYDTYQNHDDPTDESLFRKAYRLACTGSRGRIASSPTAGIPGKSRSSIGAPCCTG